MDDLIAKIEKAWGRQALCYSSKIYSLHLEEALTGFFLMIDEPTIGEFDGEKCVCVNLAEWIMVKTLSDQTATPFRVVAKGKNLIQKGFLPHVGLAHAVRQHNDTLMAFVPISEFKPV